jgi:hypothetical protein
VDFKKRERGRRRGGRKGRRKKSALQGEGNFCLIWIFFALPRDLSPMNRPSNKRAASPPAAAASTTSAKRSKLKQTTEADEDEPVIEHVFYAGTCQPMTTVANDDDGSTCMPISPMLLDMDIIWQNNERKRGTVRGTISWTYGLFWASQSSMEYEDQMFWKVAAQHETIAGEVVVHREKSYAKESHAAAAAAAAVPASHETRMFSFRTRRLGVLDTEDSTIEREEGSSSSGLDAGIVSYALDMFERERVYHFSSSSSTHWQLHGTVSVAGAGENDAEDESGAARGMPLTHVTLHRLPHNLQHRAATELVDPLALMRGFSKEKTQAAEQKLREQSLDAALIDRLLKIITRIVETPDDESIRSLGLATLQTKFPRLVSALHILGFSPRTDASAPIHKERLVWGNEQDLMHLCDLSRVLTSLLPPPRK